MTIFFQNREGQTPIDHNMLKHLIPDHINDMGELYAFENVNIASAIEWINSTKDNHLDYLIWLRLHKKMYCDVWKFSGKIRKEELNNPEFLMPYEVSGAIKLLQDDLTYWLKNKTFSDKETIARFHESLLKIHPFLDGNGRWSRLLCNFICNREKIIEPNWGKDISDDELRRQDYLDAIKTARNNDEFEDLINFIF